MAEEIPTPNKPIGRVRLVDIENKFKENFLLADPYALEFLSAAVVSNKMPHLGKPVWIVLVAPSSGGKTAFLDMFSLLQGPPYELTYGIGDLTPQTFISGMVGKKDQSLLKKLDGKIIFCKDFTTIMQKNPDARRELLSQLREIYDGEFNKEFGTGVSIHWKGNVGFISALTPIGLDLMQQHSTMGERFINYALTQPPQDALAEMMKKKYRRTASEIVHQDDELQKMVAEYISRKVLEAEALMEPYPIQDDMLDEINEVSQFATRSRSPVQLDFKTKEPIDVPIIEGFGRFALQLQTITKTLMLMQEGSHDITDRHVSIIRKVALDSIPRKRRLTMQIVSSFSIVSTSAFSARIGLPTDTARSWLMELASLELITRIPRGGKGNEDGWKMSPYGTSMMKKYDGITPSTKSLLDEEEARIFSLPQDQQAQVEEQKAIQLAQIRNQAITAIQEELGEDTSWEEAEMVYNDRELAKQNAEHADIPERSPDELFEEL